MEHLQGFNGFAAKLQKGLVNIFHLRVRIENSLYKLLIGGIFQRDSLFSTMHVKGKERKEKGIY